MSVERGLNGWLVIDKPAGMTSSKVVLRLRHAAGTKAGHAGTLDPLATGVLPIALGEATKTVGFVSRATKRTAFGYAGAPPPTPTIPRAKSSRRAQFARMRRRLRRCCRGS